MDAIQDKKERRRVMETFYAKRTRERKKVFIDVLAEECSRLATDNRNLKGEGERLQALLLAAKQQVRDERRTPS
jgi:hypothetical protein